MRESTGRQSAIEQHSAFVHGERRLLNHGASDGSASGGGAACAMRARWHNTAVRMPCRVILLGGAWCLMHCRARMLDLSRCMIAHCRLVRCEKWVGALTACGGSGGLLASRSGEYT